MAIFQRRLREQIEGAFGDRAATVRAHAGRRGGAVSASDPDAVRAEMLERWGRAAAGWGSGPERARLRPAGVGLDARPRRVAAGVPSARARGRAGGHGVPRSRADPPGRLADIAATRRAMLEVARARAQEFGIENVEFKQIELEWIDLATASVDAALCNWGLMLAVDPEAARGRCAGCCGRAAESRSPCGTGRRRTHGPRSRRARWSSSGTRAARSRRARDVRAGGRRGACRMCSRPPDSSTCWWSRSTRRARMGASRSGSPRPTISRACSARWSIRSPTSSARRCWPE